MKKNLIRTMSLLLVICLLFLSGCEKATEESAKTPEEFWARTHEWNSEQLMYSNANEYGYYFLNENNLIYFDYATKKSVILFNKVGCKHDDIYCEAYIQGSPFLFFRGEKMYLITSKDDGVHIFQCDLDGTNRESKILLMKDEMEKGNAVSIVTFFLSEDEVYYTAAYQEPDDGNEKKDPIKAVRLLDLNTWTEQEICRSVENAFSVIASEKEGALILEQTDPSLKTEVDWDKLSEEEKKNGVKLLTKEQMKKMPLNLFYWHKSTGDKLTVYESNFGETEITPYVSGSWLYRLGVPSGAEYMGLERMDMRTGQSEWLWKEKAGPGSMIVKCSKMNGAIYLTAANPDMEFWEEIYTFDGFQQVVLPSLGMHDSIVFEDDHGYVAWKTIEYRPNNPSGDIVDYIFIPRAEAGKANPEYTVLCSYGLN